MNTAARGRACKIIRKRAAERRSEIGSGFTAGAVSRPPLVRAFSPFLPAAVVPGASPQVWSFYIRDNGTGLQPSSLHRHDLILGRCPRLLWLSPSALEILTSDAKAV